MSFDNQYQKASILIVEDESGIVEFIKTGLEYEGFLINSVEKGTEAIKFLENNDCDLIILDIMLPDIDGFEVCKRIRQSCNSVPIIMLTAKKDVTDRVTGLNIGADDYLTKPFNFEELLARIRALLRRTNKNFEMVELHIAGISLNKETKTVRRNGKKIILTPTEFSLLQLFMENPERVFTRETLLNRLFGYNYVNNTNIIDVHISHLREKIGDRSANIIRTRYGIGYYFYPGEEIENTE